MPDAPQSEKVQAVTNKMKALMNGRGSWFKSQLNAELNLRTENLDGSFYLRFADNNKLIGSLNAPDTEAALRAFGMKKQDLASILGVPDDWAVSARGRRSADGSYIINLDVQHPLARMSRMLYMRDGKPTLYNSSFFAAASAPKGLGLEIFSKSVANAKRLGISKIETMPCRSGGPNGMVGYAVWPQFGYDAPLSSISDSYVRQQVTTRFPQAQTIRDIYDTPGGQQWWWEHGTSLSKAEFHLDDDSRNIRALESYMSRKKSARNQVRSSGTGAA